MRRSVTERNFHWVQDPSGSVPNSIIPLLGLCANRTCDGASTAGYSGEGLLLVDVSLVSNLSWPLKDFLWFLRGRKAKVSSG